MQNDTRFLKQIRNFNYIIYKIKVLFGNQLLYYLRVSIIFLVI